MKENLYFTVQVYMWYDSASEQTEMLDVRFVYGQTDNDEFIADTCLLKKVPRIRFRKSEGGPNEEEYNDPLDYSIIDEENNEGSTIKSNTDKTTATKNKFVKMLSDPTIEEMTAVLTLHATCRRT